MAPITAPWSVELAKDEDLKAAVVGTTSAVVAGKVKVFLGSAVLVNRRQSIAGAIKVLKRVLFADAMRDSANNVDIVISGHWQHVTTGSAVVAADVLALTNDDVALVIAGDFTTGEESHFYEETIDQLISAFLEQSAGT